MSINEIEQWITTQNIPRTAASVQKCKICSQLTTEQLKMMQEAKEKGATIFQLTKWLQHKIPKMYATDNFGMWKKSVSNHFERKHFIAGIENGIEDD